MHDNPASLLSVSIFNVLFNMDSETKRKKRKRKKRSYAAIIKLKDKLEKKITWQLPSTPLSSSLSFSPPLSLSLSLSVSL